MKKTFLPVVSFQDSIAILYWKRQLESHLSNQQQLKIPHNTPTDVDSVYTYWHSTQVNSNGGSAIPISDLLS